MQAGAFMTLQNCIVLGLEFFFPVFISQIYVEHLLSSGHCKSEKVLPSSCFSPVGEVDKSVMTMQYVSFCNKVYQGPEKKPLSPSWHRPVWGSGEAV